MQQLSLNAQILTSLNYLYKHLYDNPAQNPTNVPKIGANGRKIAKIDQIANILNTERKIAAHYVLQDPKTDIELKNQAYEALMPGIYVSAEDSYEPVLHQAYSILNQPIESQKKDIRLVRTVNGVRRYKQKRGSIIIRDGESPLDALTALPNDVPGYEKLAGKNGGVYYVGNEQGKWVVRDPASNTIVRVSDNEEEIYSWLNEAVGGEKHKKPKTNEAARVLGAPTSSRAREVDEGELARDTTLSREDAEVVNKLTNEELDMYKRLRERGLSHADALKLAVMAVPQKAKKK